MATSLVKDVEFATGSLTFYIFTHYFDVKKSIWKRGALFLSEYCNFFSSLSRHHIMVDVISYGRPVTDAFEVDTHAETSAAYGLNVLIVD